MAERAPEPVQPLQILQGEADGYCDPVTGVCAVPGVAPPEPTTSDDDNDTSAAGVPSD
ncbi:hypothetical protein ABZ922_44070 [Streptomyces shenzhenensis]|uniref:hypothetical protein n=1 Tax=Streptomyces shenzhenensis TaxID=943815 RepID=UPI0033CF31A1